MAQARVRCLLWPYPWNLRRTIMETKKSSNRRILVIDDNRAIHADFRKIFNPAEEDESALADAEAALFGDAAPCPASQPGFELDSAFQGQEGLALIQQALEEKRPYAMAFVDVRMPPGWDGIETIARIWNIRTCRLSSARPTQIIRWRK